MERGARAARAHAGGHPALAARRLAACPRAAPAARSRSSWDATSPTARLAHFVAVYERTIDALARAGTRIEHVDLRYRNGFAARVPGFQERAAEEGGVSARGRRTKEDGKRW